jgi:hypothetical protein
VSWFETSASIRKVGAAGYALAAILLATLAGCQPVPQPFAHTGKATNPIAIPQSDYAGVTILPIPGLSGSRAHSLSVAMADELLAHDIIAGPNSSNQRSRFLQGGLSQKALGGDRLEIKVLWDLTDRNGKILGSHETSRRFSKSAWSKGGRSVITPLVKGPALEIARLIKGESDDEADKSRLSLYVWPLEGAPENAAGPLRQAMENALKKRNYRVADSLDGAKLIIAGTIELGPQSAEPRPIRIVWSVMSPAGKELGKLTQKNSLPRQAMENRWGVLADIIADNAADGLSDVVVRLPRNALLSREKPAK